MDTEWGSFYDRPMPVCQRCGEKNPERARLDTRQRPQAIPEPEHQGDLHGTATAERKRPERDRRPEVVQAEGKPEDEKLNEHVIADCCN